MATTNPLDGPPTGVMASEFTHPFYDFLDAGIQVDLASIQGGPAGRWAFGPIGKSLSALTERLFSSTGSH